MNRKITILIGIVGLLMGLFTTSIAWAKVSAEEAQRLKKDLTPLGAERAGNADGTIPPWEGGITAPPEGIGYKGPGDFHPDPFKEDKVLFSITAQNLNQYADKLAEGTKALLKKYPDSFRLDVYPTRRSAAAPEGVYEGTYKNATRCELTDDGTGIIANGGINGIPFPIPQKGAEVIFNHLLRWRGEGAIGPFRTYHVQPSGRVTMNDEYHIQEIYPWYPKDSVEKFKGNYNYALITYTKPSRRKGDMFLMIDPLNQSEDPSKSWMYLPGQRRVRRSPNLTYDGIIPGTSDLMFWDMPMMFTGAIDRYNWKIVGKKEMYIPYNNYAVDLVESKALLTPNHINPDHMRWELHRVWKIEATLKEGLRHAFSKRVMYMDEDSWVVLLGDYYDGRGNLWRIQMGTLKNAYEVPCAFLRIYSVYDLTRDDYIVPFSSDSSLSSVKFNRLKNEDYFTPETLRRLGRR